MDLYALYRRFKQARRVRSVLQVLNLQEKIGELSTIESLLALLKKTDFSTYRRARGKQTFLEMRYRNIDTLIMMCLILVEDLQSALDEIGQFGLESTVRPVSLDAFLVTENDTPLHPDEVVPRLIQATEAFYYHYGIMLSTQDPRSTMTVAKTMQLREELKNVIVSLIHIGH